MQPTGPVNATLEIELGGGHFATDWYTGAGTGSTGQLLLQIVGCMCVCTCVCMCVYVCVVNFLCCCCAQNIYLSNGTVIRSGTGDGVSVWLTSTDGPIISASVYGGQTTDYTRNQALTQSNRCFSQDWTWVPAMWSGPIALPPLPPTQPCATFGCTSLQQQLGSASMVSCILLIISLLHVLFPIIM